MRALARDDYINEAYAHDSSVYITCKSVLKRAHIYRCFTDVHTMQRWTGTSKNMDMCDKYQNFSRHQWLDINTILFVEKGNKIYMYKKSICISNSIV